MQENSHTVSYNYGETAVALRGDEDKAREKVVNIITTQCFKSTEEKDLMQRRFGVHTAVNSPVTAN